MEKHRRKDPPRESKEERQRALIIVLGLLLGYVLCYFPGLLANIYLIARSTKDAKLARPPLLPLRLCKTMLMVGVFPMVLQILSASAFLLLRTPPPSNFDEGHQPARQSAETTIVHEELVSPKGTLDTEPTPTPITQKVPEHGVAQINLETSEIDTERDEPQKVEPKLSIQSADAEFRKLLRYNEIVNVQRNIAQWATQREKYQKLAEDFERLGFRMTVENPLTGERFIVDRTNKPLGRSKIEGVIDRIEQEIQLRQSYVVAYAEELETTPTALADTVRARWSQLDPDPDLPYLYASVDFELLSKQGYSSNGETDVSSVELNLLFTNRTGNTIEAMHAEIDFFNAFGDYLLTLEVVHDESIPPGGNETVLFVYEYAKKLRSAREMAESNLSKIKTTIHPRRIVFSNGQKPEFEGKRTWR